eukprot:GHVT01034889.1.p1 GENE.GHVT01034889.1~~GHVT01034889.1.p1  ORF type:complete len:576 (+),score=96.76 GHVT01034889.1:489-2216(+)
MSRTAIQTFEDYQKSRVAFVQSVAELATRPQNIPALQQAGAISLLRPLLLDTLPSIQQSAALALGRLASHNEELATAVVQEDVLPQLIFSLNHQNRYYKRAAAFVLRAVAKQSPKLAEEVVKAGALDALIGCLEEFDPSVKEAAAWALGYLARHTPELASSVIDAGAIPLLVLSYREPELGLKRVAASALADIAKHSQDLAQAVVDGGAVTLLARDAGHSDAQLKRQVFSCLAHIAKHSIDLAETVVEAEIFPRILHSLGDADEAVRKNAATCMREICRHSVELAKFVVNAGGAVALVDLAADSRGSCRLPAVMGLGYISAFAESLALAVVVARGIPALKDALVTEPEDHIRAAAAWALGCIGRHSPEHARALAEGDVLRRFGRQGTRPVELRPLPIVSTSKLRSEIRRALINRPTPNREIECHKNGAPKQQWDEVCTTHNLRRPGQSTNKIVCRAADAKTPDRSGQATRDKLRIGPRQTSATSVAPERVPMTSGYPTPGNALVLNCSCPLGLREQQLRGSSGVTSRTAVMRASLSRFCDVCVVHVWPSSRLLSVYMDSESSADLKSKTKTALQV